MFQLNTTRKLMWMLICILLLVISGCGDSETTVHESWVASPEGTVFDDNVISSNIMSRLSSSPELENLGLSVRVENGEVFLSGTAKNQAQIDHAVMQAWLVDGVQKLNNHITLESTQ
jgi:hyperosmotically inducible periplasmic protein